MGRRRFVRLVGVLCVGYLAWMVTLLSCQSRLVFPRDIAGDATMTVSPHEGDEIWLTGADGVRVEAWFLPGAGRTADSPGPAVIAAHGNAELIEHSLERARMYTRHGISVLLPEYRGYGRSGGTPSERAIVSDYVRFYDLLAARPEVDRSRIVYHGRSLGGGVASRLAVERPPAALILESTFTSVVAMARRYAVPGFLVSNPFRVDEAVRSLDRPVLILHGRDDEIIPVAHARRLHELAPGSVLVEAEGGHNDFPVDREGYERAILHFLRSHDLAGGDGAGAAAPR